MIRILLACAILLGVARASAADDQLGSISYFFGTGNDVDFTKVVAISFEFGYDGSPEGPVCVRHRVGCMPIPVAQLVPGATFTFDASNSPWFAEIAATLTNAVNQQLFFVDKAWSSLNRVLAGSGRGGPTEAVAFGVPTDLHGFTITSIRLAVNTFQIGDNASCGGVPGGLCYQANLTWTIYGVPISTPVRSTSWGQVRATYR
jgi:hypothetical protein